VTNVSGNWFKVHATLRLLAHCGCTMKKHTAFLSALHYWHEHS